MAGLISPGPCKRSNGLAIVDFLMNNPLCREVPPRAMKPWVRSFFEKPFYEELTSLAPPRRRVLEAILKVG